MINMIIVDTGFWIALANRKDQFHTLAVDILSKLQEPLITTWPVITETCYLLLSRLGCESQLRFIEELQERTFEVFDIQEIHYKPLMKLMRKYADLPMDLADASLVILAENLGHGRILSTDRRDFHGYRWKQRHPFENLLDH